ncbi:hypothetical protein FHW71_001578 [Enterobacter sp. Sphag1F]|nr:hypothetical protein [Enterobacter sp. Sphag1F]NYI13870.1 hypothetical protein [Enterobacter sp. Sphag71]
MRAFCFSAFTDSEKHRVAFQSAAIAQRHARLLLYSMHGFLQTSGDFPMQAELHCAVIRSLAG